MVWLLLYMHMRGGAVLMDLALQLCVKGATLNTQPDSNSIDVGGALLDLGHVPRFSPRC